MFHAQWNRSTECSTRLYSRWNCLHLTVTTWYCSTPGCIPLETDPYPTTSSLYCSIPDCILVYICNTWLNPILYCSVHDWINFDIVLGLTVSQLILFYTLTLVDIGQHLTVSQLILFSTWLYPSWKCSMPWLFNVRYGSIIAVSQSILFYICICIPVDIILYLVVSQ